ncbi:hypothetical protein B566_EDAN018443 [Ephemera danica]|nr:hypothetical protein B566_EDAN018443 [Ephemera danica]
MERRSFVRSAGLAGVLAAGAAPAIVHAQQNIRWRIASSFPKSLDTLFGVCDVFAAKVKDLSGGKFVITTHAAGELMPAFGVLDGVGNGTVEMANTAPYYFFGKDPTYALDCAIPFVTGVRTGFFDLDRNTAGLQKGDLIVLAARPSMGKTAFALNIAEHVAVAEGLPVLVFSMEMGASQLALRMVGSLGRIDQGHLRTGRLGNDEWERLAEAVDRLGKVQLFIDESPALTSSELRARARRMARQFGGTLGLVVVDYLQLMSGSSTNEENRATTIGEISRGLKSLAKELQCPVIALSQLNRSVETRPDKRPMMSDLRESGAIEQDADVIMFIYRDEYYNKDSKEPGVAEIIIGKQRNGPTGTTKLTFLKPLTKFDNLAPGSFD